jgi:hypothetical protein
MELKTRHIPEMTPESVHDYLREIGSKWSGKGVAIELGSWLGASAAPLLEGLVQAKYDKPFYSYDKWRCNDEQVLKSREQGLRLLLGQDLQPIFLKNVQGIYSNIISCKGDLRLTIRNYPKEPIEICLFDAPKREPIFSNAIYTLLPYFIEGVTIFGLLDYYFYMRREGKEREPYLAPVKFIEAHKDNFVKIKEWEPKENSCVFFKYVKKI